MRNLAVILSGVAGLAVMAGLSPAPGAQRLPMETMLRTYLGCAVEQEKVLIITNTTGKALGSTNITFDSERKPDRVHAGRTFTVSSLAAGAFIRIGWQPSFSCTAWIKRVRLLAPG